MNGVEVIIKGIAFKMIFNLKVFRLLGKEWKLDSLPEVTQRISLLDKLESGSLEAFDVFFDLLFVSIDANSENENKISKAELENLSIEEMTALVGKMTEGITGSFPTESETEKKTTVKKAVKK